jgi:molecular chaperone HscB
MRLWRKLYCIVLIFVSLMGPLGPIFIRDWVVFDFKQNYFSLFNLKTQFKINDVELQHNWRELQKQFHPDKFINQGQFAVNQALQISSHINQAYAKLASPVSRAIYLLHLQGIEIDLTYATQLSLEFLQQQMELQETVVEAQARGDLKVMEELEQLVLREAAALELQLATAFELHNQQSIMEIIKHLAFYNKLHQRINNIILSL